ncbi:protein DYAD-like [Nymphaea colorata]|nr:protein DYAD-like [Nymphaea colorata]
MASSDSHDQPKISVSSDCLHTSAGGGSSCHSKPDLHATEGTGKSEGAADDKTDDVYAGMREKGDGDVVKAPLARHMKGESSNSESSGAIAEGFLYEIDHGKLPPKAPIQLKGVRVVLVSERSELNVSVKFPSILSLRKYFGKNTMGRNPKANHPELDEQFVMRANLAIKVLRRLVLPSEFQKVRHLESFWMLSGELNKRNPNLRVVIPQCLSSPTRQKPISQNDEPEEGGIPPECPGGPAAKTVFLVSWGVRRKVQYVGQHKDIPELENKENTEPSGVAYSAIRKKRRELKKRRDECPLKEERPKKVAKKVKPKDVLGRWSSDRYRAAQLKLLDIMHAKGAVLGKPILRPELREEARKHIGDTGLLDHLLKHMTDTVIGNGERFRRRHNSEGAMEYWLEGANLVEQRKEAGICDPFWIPPPNWKPGDEVAQQQTSVPTDLAMELSGIKDELSNIRRDLETLRSTETTSFVGMKKNSEAFLEFSTDKHHGAELRDHLSEVIGCLLRKKTELENHLAEVSTSLNQMQLPPKGNYFCISNSISVDRISESLLNPSKRTGSPQEEMRQIFSQLGSYKPLCKSSDEGGNGSEESTGVPGKAEEDGERQQKQLQHGPSGFRVCKPHGTFLWPSMASKLGTANNNLSPSPHLVAEDILTFPPPSASSGTADSPTSTQHQALSPVKPLPRIRAAVAKASLVVPENAGEVDSTAGWMAGPGCNNADSQFVPWTGETPNQPKRDSGLSSFALMAGASAPLMPSLWLALATPPSTSLTDL